VDIQRLEMEVEEAVVRELSQRRNPSKTMFIMWAAHVRQVTTKLINHIRKTYTDGEDIATALETLQDVHVKDWKPQIDTTVDSDDQIRATEQK